MRRNRFVVVALLCSGLALGVGGWLTHYAVSIPLDSKNTTPALAAGIALIGVLVTAAVTLVGCLFRQSIDLCTTKLAEQGSQLAAAEQQRLQLQAAMETLKLLATSEGKPATISQASGALMVLAALGYARLLLT